MLRGDATPLSYPPLQGRDDRGSLSEGRLASCESTGRGGVGWQPIVLSGARVESAPHPVSHSLRSCESTLPLQGRVKRHAYSLPDISAAFPPAAAVFTVTVCSVAKRAR
jgi:hypothetical protein